MQPEDNVTVVALMDREYTPPDSHQLIRISSEAMARAKTFESVKRQNDFLWSRLLLNYAIHKLGLDIKVIEQPPYSPKLLSSTPFFASVSHTSTYVGVAVSASPIALDLEVIDPSRPIKAMFSKVFGKDLLEKTPKRELVLTFYRYWGLHECAIKLQGKLKISTEGVTVENTAKQLAPCVFLTLNEKTLLTVVSEKEVPIKLMHLKKEML